jgi:hypothetical protein
VTGGGTDPANGTSLFYGFISSGTGIKIPPSWREFITRASFFLSSLQLLKKLQISLFASQIYAQINDTGKQCYLQKAQVTLR